MIIKLELLSNCLLKKKTVGCCWIYKIKYKGDGTVQRHKARLVGRDFTQTYEEDYIETFAPVAKMTTFRVLLSLAANQGWELSEMDAKVHSCMVI